MAAVSFKLFSFHLFYYSKKVTPVGFEPTLLIGISFNLVIKWYALTVRPQRLAWELSLKLKKDSATFEKIILL